MKKEDFIEKVKYAFIAWDGEMVVHQVLYWNKPTDYDMKHVYEEIRIDEDFGVGDVADSWEWYLINEEEHPEIWAWLKTTWQKMDTRLDSKYE